MKDTEYNIRIAKVRENSADCHINRWEAIRHNGEKIDVTLTSKFAPHPASKSIALRLTTTYRYTRAMVRHTLLQYSIEMEFDISPYPDTMAGTNPTDGIDIPPRLMLLMYGPAIGALRGMLAIRTASSFLKDYPLPLINISALVSAHVNGRSVPSDIVPITDFHYS